MMVHTCNSSYSGVEGQEDHSSRPGKKLARLHLNKLGMAVYIWNPRYAGGINRRLTRPTMGKKGLGG
jgi:hypothetical protein